MYEPNQYSRFFVQGFTFEWRMLSPNTNLHETTATRALVEIGLSGFRCWGYGKQQARL